MRLARVGIEKVRGYLEGGVDAWTLSHLPRAQTPQITVQGLQQGLSSPDFTVLDVRREPEWQAGHIEDASWWPLDNFKVSPPEIDRGKTTAVHCKSGYRSMIACSLLERAGFSHVVNVVGGFDAWQQAGLPVEANKPVEVSAS